MNIKIETLIHFNDLTFSKQEEIKQTVGELVKENEQLMSEIKELCEMEEKEGKEFGSKLVLQDYIDLKVEDTVNNLVPNYREYITFEGEAKLK